jgi:hypothetical protein
MRTRRSLRYAFFLILAALVLLPAAAQDEIHHVSYDQIHFSYPASLFDAVQIESIDAVPYSADLMFAETYPQHVRFSFLNYADGAMFELPYPFLTPQILVYHTDAIREFGEDFAVQYEELSALLNERPDLSAYAGASVTQPETRLPFLPWVNSAQILRSKPEYVELEGGSGIRYLTVYSQGIGPLTDRQVFYTFQGIVANGTIYVSAILPVKTGVWPEVADMTGVDMDAFTADYGQYLTDAAAQLGALENDAFMPCLSVLDALVGSIVVDPDIDLEPIIDSPEC